MALIAAGLARISIVSAIAAIRSAPMTCATGLLRRQMVTIPPASALRRSLGNCLWASLTWYVSGMLLVLIVCRHRVKSELERVPGDLTADGRVDEFMRRVVEFARLENGVFPRRPRGSRQRHPAREDGPHSGD